MSSSAPTFLRVPELEAALLFWEYWYLDNRDGILKSPFREKFRRDHFACFPEQFRTAQLRVNGKSYEDVRKGWSMSFESLNEEMEKVHRFVYAFANGLLSWQCSGRRVFDVTSESLDAVLSSGDTLLDVPVDRVPWPAQTFLVRPPKSASIDHPDRGYAFLFSRDLLSDAYPASKNGVSTVALQLPKQRGVLEQFMNNEKLRREYDLLMKGRQYHGALNRIRGFFEETNGKKRKIEGCPHFGFHTMAGGNVITMRQCLALTAGKNPDDLDMAFAYRLALGVTAILARRNAKRKGISTAVPVVKSDEVQPTRTLEMITSTDDVCVITQEDVKAACEPDEPPVPRVGTSGWEMPYIKHVQRYRRPPNSLPGAAKTVLVKAYEVHPEKKPEGVEGLDPGKRTVVR